MNELKNVAIRMVAAPPLYSEERIESPEDVVRVLGKELETYDREVTCVVNLRSDLSPINMNIASMGTVNASLLCAREVFKTSILSNAASIMLVHNHPSGRVAPSRQDLLLTQKIRDASEIMGIPLMDHVIVGLRGEYFSFLKNGLLAQGKDGERGAAGKESVREQLRRYRGGSRKQTPEKGQKRHPPNRDAGR